MPISPYTYSINAQFEQDIINQLKKEYNIVKFVYVDSIKGRDVLLVNYVVTSCHKKNEYIPFYFRGYKTSVNHTNTEINLRYWHDKKQTRI